MTRGHWCLLASSAPLAGCTIFTILAYLPHHCQFCSAPRPMTTGHQRQLYSPSQANDTRSSASDMPFWCPICLMEPHMPCGAPYASWRPICLRAPHMPHGAPSALWCPICLMPPHLPFWHPSAFLVPTSAFWCPICLLQAPSAFWLPPLFLRPMTKCPTAKGALVYNSQGAICG